MKRHISTLIGIIALVGSACGASAPEAQTSVCEDAANVVESCTGERPAPPESCDGETATAAQRVADGGCAALADGKDDSAWSCSRWTRWLDMCDDGEHMAYKELVEELLAFGPNDVYSGRGHFGGAFDHPSDEEEFDCVARVRGFSSTDDGAQFRATVYELRPYQDQEQRSFRLSTFEGSELRDWRSSEGLVTAHAHEHSDPEYVSDGSEQFHMTYLDHELYFDEPEQSGIFTMALGAPGDEISCTFHIADVREFVNTDL